jgi:hypothetical protein
MMIDLEIYDNETVKFSFIKPVNFEESCDEFNISNSSLSMSLNFEYYLAQQINTLIKNSIPVRPMYLALLELKIPTDVPLRISLTKATENDLLWWWYFDLSLVRNKVTIQMELPIRAEEKSNTICD